MKIHIPHQVYEKIMYWVNKADFEVSGFGKCSHEGGVFTVTSAILLKQEGGAAHTDIDATSLSKAQYVLRDEPGEMCFWWHSHVDMPTFMSSTDKETIKELGKHGWAVACVFNKKAECTSALSYKYEAPFGGDVTHYDEKLEMIITYPALTEEEKKDLDAQFTENVTRKYLPAITGVGPYNSGPHNVSKINQPGFPKSNHEFTDWDQYLAYQAQYDADADDDGDLEDIGDPEFYTQFEKDCSEAMGYTPKKFRNAVWKAGTKEIEQMTEEIAIYWVTKRGSYPRDFTGEYDFMDFEAVAGKQSNWWMEGYGQGFGEHNA